MGQLWKSYGVSPPPLKWHPAIRMYGRMGEQVKGGEGSRKAIMDQIMKEVEILCENAQSVHARPTYLYTSLSVSLDLLLYATHRLYAADAYTTEHTKMVLLVACAGWLPG